MLFYFLLLLCPLVAWLEPSIGEKAPESIYLACVAGIFFCTGLQIDRTEFSDTRQHVKAALGIQSGSFIFMPLLAFLLLRSVFVWLGIPPHYSIGILFTAMLPVTTTSCGAFCQLAGVPPLDAVMNAILGNILGVLILPFLIPYLLLPEESDKYAAMWGAMLQIGLLVVVPLLLGYLFGGRAVFRQFNLRAISQTFLLWIIYRSYCKSFTLIYLEEAGFLYALFFGMLIFHVFGNFLALGLASVLRFGNDMKMIFLFTIPQKTIVLGLPLAAALASNEQNTQLWIALVLPLLLYNNIQYIVAGSIAYFKGR